MDTNGEETVTDQQGSTKGIGCKIHCVYVSLPFKTEPG